MTVEDWEALRSLGFDEMGCLEVAHIVGIFNYLTRLADGFGLELHPALMEAARSGMPLRRAGGWRGGRAPRGGLHPQHSGRAPSLAGSVTIFVSAAVDPA